MKTNEEVQKDVMDAIKWQPLLNAAEIGVVAKDGIVTLIGVVDGYMKKVEAQEAAESVNGVKAIVQKIEVCFSFEPKDADSDLAIRALAALNASWSVPADKVKVEVEKGWLTLEGELAWNMERDAAREAVKALKGVTGVTNNIKIRLAHSAIIETDNIKHALCRNALLAHHDISVHVSGHIVTLSGTVDSFFQKNEAERIAWNAPGVLGVENQLAIEYVGLLV